MIDKIKCIFCGKIDDRVCIFDICRECGFKLFSQNVKIVSDTGKLECPACIRKVDKLIQTDDELLICEECIKLKEEKYTMNIEKFFIKEANKYNHYLATETENKDKKCIDCIRKHYSYPDCCNEGWEHLNKTGCLNFKSKEHVINL